MRRNAHLFLEVVLASSFVLLTGSHAFARISEAAFEKKFCSGNCEALLVTEHDPADPLSIAEHYLIQKYTESYSILDKEMFAEAIAKIPTTTLKAYRGTEKSRYKISRVGQVIQFNQLTSVSGDRTTAENFVKDQLLVINTKSAHSITRYSALGEQEFILLPGVNLKVDRISKEKVDLSSEGEENIIDVEVVRLTEI